MSQFVAMTISVSVTLHFEVITDKVQGIKAQGEGAYFVRD